MTFEEFEKADGRALRAEAKDRFDFTNNPNCTNEFRIACLLEAQFYMQELDRRESTRIGTRDYRMEWVVIGLIGLEIVLAIVLAIWGGYQQAHDVQHQITAFGKMQEVLTHLEESSRATASTLTTLETTTETMNDSLQKQLALSYDVMLIPTYDSGSKKIVFTNSGRSNIALFGWKIEGLLPSVEQGPRTIVPGSSYGGEVGDLNNFLTRSTQIGVDRLVPFEVYVKNERGEEFTVYANFAMSCIMV